MKNDQKTYELFVLGTFAHPGMQLDRLEYDSSPPSSLGFDSRALMHYYKSTYTEKELEITEEVIIEYHVHRIAKLMAVEMVATGKSNVATLQEMLLLPDDRIDDVIRLTNTMAKAFDARVRDANNSSTDHTYTGKL